jgi:hypothetical protein
VPDPAPYLPRATDAEIERVIEVAIPELREALKTVMQDHNPIDCFDIAKGTSSKTGVKTRYVCFIAHEFAACILEGTMKGIGDSMKAQMDLAASLSSKRL